MILFFIFVFICMFYNELVFLLQTEKESRKIKSDHPRWPNVVVKMAPVRSTGIVWIGTVRVGKKKNHSDR